MPAIYKKELSSYFNSTLGYIIIALYLLFSGFFFWMICFSSGANAMADVVNYMLYIVFFLVPLITMKSFAEEKRQHTDQALFTAPVGLWEIVGGKYLSALTLYAICNLSFIFYALILTAVTGATVAWGHLLGAILGILLLGAAMLSLNLLFSSLTEHQIIAAVVGIATIGGSFRQTLSRPFICSNVFLGYAIQAPVAFAQSIEEPPPKAIIA